MKFPKKYLDAIGLLCLLALFLPLEGCGEGSCDDNGSAVPLAWFYGSGTTKQVTVGNVTVYAIGAPGDTVLVNNQSVNELSLPLRVSTDRTQWCLTFMTTDSLFVTDTLTLAYRPIEYFASVECGTMYIFDLQQVTSTHNVIDSVLVTQPHVTNVEQVNLRIYVPTAQQ